MKTCTDCKIEKPLTEFSINQNKADGRNFRCKECVRNYNKIHYASNKQEYLDKAHRRKLKIKEMIQLAKSKPCADCGNQYHYCVMDFDHVRGEKLFQLSYGYTKSLEAIEEELSKCDVVCSNCHRIRTFNRSRGLMDEASLSESEDSRFDSFRER